MGTKNITGCAHRHAAHADADRRAAGEVVDPHQGAPDRYRPQANEGARVESRGGGGGGGERGGRGRRSPLMCLAHCACGRTFAPLPLPDCACYRFRLSLRLPRRANCFVMSPLRMSRCVSCRIPPLPLPRPAPRPVQPCTSCRITSLLPTPRSTYCCITWRRDV
jgi:hypothetical protein